MAVTSTVTAVEDTHLFQPVPTQAGGVALAFVNDCGRPLEFAWRLPAETYGEAAGAATVWSADVQDGVTTEVDSFPEHIWEARPGLGRIIDACCRSPTSYQARDHIRRLITYL